MGGANRLVHNSVEVRLPQNRSRGRARKLPCLADMVLPACSDISFLGQTSISLRWASSTSTQRRAPSDQDASRRVRPADGRIPLFPICGPRYDQISLRLADLF